jgi:hypothetical protein
MLYPAGYGFPSPFGCRHSLFDPSFSRWGVLPSSQSAYYRVSGRPHRGFHVPHEGDLVGMDAFFTPGPSVFMPGQEGIPGPITIQYRRINRVSAILR